MKNIHSFAKAALEAIGKKISGESKPIPVKSLPELSNKLGGGLYGSTVIGLVGQPGAGKTQLALQMALDAAAAGAPIIFFGLEISEQELIARLISLLTGIAWSDIFQGKISVAQFERCKRALGEKIENLDFFFEDGGNKPLQYTLLLSMAANIRRQYKDEPKGSRPIVVFVDYLQLLAGGPREDVRERVSKAAYVLRKIANDLNACVVALSSTARANYGILSDEKQKLGDGNPARFMGAGKESGDIEFAVDTLLVLAREWKNAVEGISRVWMAAPKIRAGEPCWIPLQFTDGSRFEVEDMTLENSDGDQVAEKPNKGRSRGNHVKEVSPEDEALM
jgi:replicative DNA helicase